MSERFFYSNNKEDAAAEMSHELLLKTISYAATYGLSIRAFTELVCSSAMTFVHSMDYDDLVNYASQYTEIVVHDGEPDDVDSYIPYSEEEEETIDNLGFALGMMKLAQDKNGDIDPDKIDELKKILDELKGLSD